ncbi:hypothetical protein MMC13_005367 [Lambiella insularis]|nr:hypothetical protein [Lambiella insularis]
MQFFTFVVAWVTLSVAGLNTLAVPTSHGPRDESHNLIPIGTYGNNYTIYNSTWTGPVVPGGPNVLTLKTQDITNQIRYLNPAYDFFASTSQRAYNITANSHRPVFNLTENGLLSRSAIVPPNCNVPGLQLAPNVNWINAMVVEWFGYNVEIYVGPGPRNCGEIGCFENNGIGLCNDASIRVPLPYLLVNYAAVIAADCAASREPVSGQEFDTDNYNVIVTACGANYSPVNGV